MKLSQTALCLFLLAGGSDAFTGLTNRMSNQAVKATVLMEQSDGGMSSYDRQMAAMMNAGAPPSPPVESTPDAAPLAPPVMGEIGASEEASMAAAPSAEEAYDFEYEVPRITKNNFAATRQAEFFDKWRQVERGVNITPVYEQKTKAPERMPHALKPNNFSQSREVTFFEKWRQVESGTGEVPSYERKTKDPKRIPHALKPNNFFQSKKDTFYNKWKQVEKGL